LDITLEVRQTPLKLLAIEAHLGAVVVWENPLIITDQLDERFAFPIFKDAKDRLQQRDSHPQPSFLVLRLGG
jgi:hypothetical protein